jgi:hypothetical protein
LGYATLITTIMPFSLVLQDVAAEHPVTALSATAATDQLAVP